MNFSAAGATKNLRRFGQSIKRVVREVKEDSGGTAKSQKNLQKMPKKTTYIYPFPSPVSESRDVLVERHNRLSAAIRILNEAYQVRKYSFFFLDIVFPLFLTSSL